MKRENGLYYTDEGDGEIALVFLHYFGGSSNTWAKVISHLDHQFRCISIDLPGFGNSQNKIKSFSVRDFAIEVEQIINDLDLKKYVLIGHSMGSKIAMAVASGQALGLTSLILIASSPATPEPISDEERNQLLNAYGDRLALEILLESITLQTLSYSDTENIIADNLRVSHDAWKWWVESGSQENISFRISINVPILVINGEYDTKLLTNTRREIMVPYLPQAEYEEMPGTKHLIPVEAPSALAGSIKNFIEKYTTKKRFLQKQKENIAI
jgi:pimeloyl-ACP methyl ester carboxylesterase